MIQYELNVKNVQIMKKSINKQTSGNKGKTVKPENKADVIKHTTTKIDSLDDEEQGFGGWLRYVYILK